MLMKNISFAILLLGIFAAAFFAYSLATMNDVNLQSGNFSYSEERFQQFKAAELPDKCKAPPGYTQEDWETHMSHHPDQYKECLA